MPTLGGSNLTLGDWSKQLEPNGGITSKIVELLNQTNEMVQDMVWLEANGPTFHRTTVRTGLPSATWRQFYQGVQPSKSSVAQVDESIGMLETRSVVDKDLAELNGDINQFRMNEAAPFVEAINQTVQQTVIYGNVSTSPEQFNGLAPRYSLLSGAGSTAENTVSGGGTGSDNTSIWLIGWGDNTVHGVFPKGTPAGLQHADLGLHHHFPDPVNAGRFFSAYVDKWEWKCGLVVRDWRYAVRVCNIDVSDLVANNSSATRILRAMTIAAMKLPSLSGVRPVFYCNRTVMTALDIQAQSQNNVYLNVGEEEGRKKVSFRGIPIKICDQITNAEARVL